MFLKNKAAVNQPLFYLLLKNISILLLLSSKTK